MSGLNSAAEAAVVFEAKEDEQNDIHPSCSKSEPDDEKRNRERQGSEVIVTRKELWSYYRMYLALRLLGILTSTP
jgi:hypothetical protein